MTDQEQPTPGQDPQSAGTAPAVANPPTAQPPAPVSQGHPWDQDLSFLADEQARSQVSDYLANTWQPRVTQLEQSVKPAQELYDAFTDAPDKTLIEVTEELYGAETAKALAQHLEAASNQEVTDPWTTEPQAPAPEVQPPPQNQRDPEVQALIDREREREEQAAFDSQFDRVKSANEGVEIDRDLFIPFVAKADRDDLTAEQVFDQAAEDYKAFASRFGTPVPTEGAPPVIGSGQASGTTPPPTEKEYANLDEALDDFFAQEKARGGEVAPPIPS